MEIKDILALVPEAQRAEAQKALDQHGAITADKVKTFIATDEGIKLIQPSIDSAVSKAIKSHDEKFMAEKLPGLVDAEVLKRHPNETPEQKRMAALEKENTDIKTSLAKEKQTAKAQKILTDMGLPIMFAERYAGLTDEETTANMGTLKAVTDWKDAEVKKNDDAWMAKGGKPGGSDGKSSGKTMKRAEFDVLSAMAKGETVKAGIEIID